MAVGQLLPRLGGAPYAEKRRCECVVDWPLLARPFALQRNLAQFASDVPSLFRTGNNDPRRRFGNRVRHVSNRLSSSRRPRRLGPSALAMTHRIVLSIVR